MTNTITLIQPDDWHVHLREGKALARTMLDTTSTFARALVMPNLKKPLIQTADVAEYRQAILSQSPVKTFIPLMTLYLTDTTSPEEISRAKETGYIISAKLYPVGVTTHSQAGIHSLKKLYPVFERMEKENLVLNIHGEVADPLCDIFDREASFIQDELIPLINHFPRLKITLEHISTQYAVEFIQQAPSNVAATITPHHLWLNRNDLLAGGIKPHYYCLPILKKRDDQMALMKIATSGHPRFFLGTDSAPHAIGQKTSACGCAGIYNAPVALPLCATLFEKAQALDKLENFTSRFGAEFYGLPLNTTFITLQKKDWVVPEQLPFGDERLVPLCAGEKLPWSLC
jgi:dihydroorotase